MTTKHIVFGQPQEPELPPEKLPPAELLSGSEIGRQDSFRVYFIKGVYEEILNHINVTPGIESGGLLVGQAFRTPDQATTFIIVTATIRQDSDNRSVGHFTVTPKEVQEARTKLETLYPGYLAVGWYHSHPGHGVFLSGQDMTIVRSIYNASWQLALVIDPLQKIEGIFVGPAGKLLYGPGRHSYYSSWTELRVAPAAVRARACFNQAQEASEAGRRDIAEAALHKLDALLRDSPELRHWGNQYPGVEALRRRVAGITDTPPVETITNGYSLASPPGLRPEPARPLSGRTLPAGLIVAAFVVLFFFVAVLISLREQALDAAIIAWGAALTLLIGLGAVMLLNGRRGRSEHALGYALLAAAILVWGGFAIMSVGRAGNSPTPTSEPVTLPAAGSQDTPAVVSSPTAVSSPVPEPSSTISPSPTAEGQAGGDVVPAPTLAPPPTPQVTGESVEIAPVSQEPAESGYPPSP